MSEEFQLTIFYIAAGVGAFACVGVHVWFMRRVERFRDGPVVATFTWASMAGAMLCLGSLATMGKLGFTIDTRWGGVQSGWIGALVCCSGLVRAKSAYAPDDRVERRYGFDSSGEGKRPLSHDRDRMRRAHCSLSGSNKFDR